MPNRETKAERLVRKVAQCYWRIKSLPPISAQNLDDSSRSTSKWTPTGCRFTVDVELALKRVFKGQTGIAELIAAWDAMQDENAPVREGEARLIRLAAREFDRLGLEPWKYFKPLRPGWSQG